MTAKKFAKFAAIPALVGAALLTTSPANAASTYETVQENLRCGDTRLDLISTFGYADGWRRSIATEVYVSSGPGILIHTTYGNWSGSGQHLSDGPTKYRRGVTASSDFVTGADWGTRWGVYNQAVIVTEDGAKCGFRANS